MPEDRAQLGTRPVPGDAPAGVSVRYDPKFEKLDSEVGKLGSVSGGTPEWREVVQIGTDILKNKSKDLLVGAYTTMGLFERDGYEGLADGATILRDMISTYWDDLFPEKKRMRARQTALDWLAERMEKALESRPDASESDREVLGKCAKVLHELDTQAAEKFDGDGPNLRPIVRLLEAKLGSIPPPPPPPGEKPPEEEKKESAPPPPPPEPEKRDVDPAEAVQKFLEETKERMLQAAKSLREADPANPDAYRLLRRALWSEFTELPEADDDRKIDGFGNDPKERKSFEDKITKRGYEEVLGEIESKLEEEPLNLDLNLHAVRAMEGMGYTYDMAREAIGAEVAALIARLPGLLDLLFNDGNPFATEEARTWITSELLPNLSPPGPADERFARTLQEAQRLVTRKKFPQATELLQKELEGVSNRRDRFLRRLEMAKLCLQVRKPQLAQPLLESLDEEARRFSIEEWEPGLCVEVVKSLWQCYSLSDGEGAKDKAHELHGRLCRLDLRAALDIKKGK